MCLPRLRKQFSWSVEVISLEKSKQISHDRLIHTKNGQPLTRPTKLFMQIYFPSKQFIKIPPSCKKHTPPKIPQFPRVFHSLMRKYIFLKQTSSHEAIIIIKKSNKKKSRHLPLHVEKIRNQVQNNECTFLDYVNSFHDRLNAT